LIKLVSTNGFGQVLGTPAGMSENHRTPQDTPQDTPQETAGHHKTPQDTAGHTTGNRRTPQDTAGHTTVKPPSDAVTVGAD